jgi:hypothetical protein
MGNPLCPNAYGQFLSSQRAIECHGQEAQSRSTDAHLWLSGLYVPTPKQTATAVKTGNSFDFGSAPPILARTNNRNCLNCLHIEKIAIDADQ